MKNKKDCCNEWVERNFDYVDLNMLRMACEKSSESGDYINRLTTWNPEDSDFWPIWGTLFQPRMALDAEFILEHLEEIEEIGFVVYQQEEFGVFLGIDGAGYDFYEDHWLPLYDLFGIKWHKQ